MRQHVGGKRELYFELELVRQHRTRSGEKREVYVAQELVREREELEPELWGMRIVFSRRNWWTSMKKLELELQRNANCIPCRCWRQHGEGGNREVEENAKWSSRRSWHASMIN